MCNFNYKDSIVLDKKKLEFFMDSFGLPKTGEMARKISDILDEVAEHQIIYNLWNPEDFDEK